MITKEDAMEMLIAISQIEVYMIGVTGLTRPAVVYDNLDKITEKLVKEVRVDNDDQ